MVAVGNGLLFITRRACRSERNNLLQRYAMTQLVKYCASFLQQYSDSVRRPFTASR